MYLAVDAKRWWSVTYTSLHAHVKMLRRWHRARAVIGVNSFPDRKRSTSKRYSGTSRALPLPLITYDWSSASLNGLLHAIERAWCYPLIYGSRIRGYARNTSFSWGGSHMVHLATIRWPGDLATIWRYCTCGYYLKYMVHLATIWSTVHLATI